MRRFHWWLAAAAAAKSLQSCPTLCNPRDGSPPGSLPGILQARTLELAALSISNAGKWKVKVKLLSRVPLVAIQWTAAYQAPQSMRFSRQEYWSGLPLPSPRLLLTFDEYTLSSWLLFLRSGEEPKRDHGNENKVVSIACIIAFHCQWSCFSKIKFSKNLLDVEKQLAMGILSWEEQSRLRVSKLNVYTHEVKQNFE